MDFIQGVLNCPYAVVSIAVTFIMVTFLVKQYFKGGVCKGNRDMTGKIVLITGGNSGIGKATV